MFAVDPRSCFGETRGSETVKATSGDVEGLRGVSGDVNTIPGDAEGQRGVSEDERTTPGDVKGQKGVSMLCFIMSLFPIVLRVH